MTDTVRYKVSGHVARLILDNPERHNSLGREELDAIQSALMEVRRNEQLRVLVFTGVGERTFCAGASLEQLGAGIIREYDFQHTAEMLHELPIPTISCSPIFYPFLSPNQTENSTTKNSILKITAWKLSLKV